MAGNSRPIDARGWIFEVQDLEAEAETWLPIAGLNTFTYNPSENEETTETVAFESEGAYEEDVMQRGASIALAGQYRVDKTTNAQDPGQAYIDNVWANLVGIDSHNPVRWRHRSQTSWVVWDATMTPGEQGGGNNDKTSWAATIRRNGWATTAAVTP
ncbi:hypothetical protein KVH22_21665 [Streptomyces olivaceus]|uniref:phage tail tube protein n=1 Tax=Streptomyces olivaceus TaxID=47716 RepID=UPI001CCF479A|nr:hypothetical protein [Streptomyces olivaceus]MBZ6258127.1 hypothetical protein [Streptomyces olivaceus]